MNEILGTYLKCSIGASVSASCKCKPLTLLSGVLPPVFVSKTFMSMAHVLRKLYALKFYIYNGLKKPLLWLHSTLLLVSHAQI